MVILDLDGGEMWIPPGILPIAVFPTLVREIAESLLQLSEMFSKGYITINGESSYFQHAFKLRSDDREIAKLIIDILEKDLPLGIKFYELEGRKIFDLRGASGGVLTACVCYLTVKVK